MDYILVRKDELYHYGVKGMKWGKRKARPMYSYATPRRASSQQYKTARISGGASYKQLKKTVNNTEEAKAARKAKAKKAVKVGAAVVGTALAAYGTYKVAKFVQNKRSDAAMKKAAKFLNENELDLFGQTKFKDGRVINTYKNKLGTELRVSDNLSKYVDKQNADTLATARKMYSDATNTRLDKGLSKIVGVGDAVGNATKRGTQAVGNAAKSAKNKVLDVVNPIYEYTPGQTRSTTRNVNGLDITESVTDYYKRKIKRK